MNIGASGESFYVLWERRLGDLEMNVEEAAEAFRNRHGKQANVCYGHSSVVQETTLGGVAVKVDDRVRPITLKVGYEPGGSA